MATVKYDGVAATPLTREDIAALRAADDITFHVSASHGVVVKAWIRKHGEAPYVWTAREQKLFPDTTGSYDRWREIGAMASARGHSSSGADSWWWSSPGEGYGLKGAPQCYANLWDNDVRATITNGLRAGDCLMMLWAADDNSDNVRAVNYHRDHLKLRVQHVDDMEGKTLRTYLLAVQVGPDNSARMVKR